MAETLYTVDAADGQLWSVNATQPASSTSLGTLPTSANGTPSAASAAYWIDGDSRLFTIDVHDLTLAVVHGTLPDGLASVSGLASGTTPVAITTNPGAIWTIDVSTPGSSAKSFDLPDGLRYPTGLTTRPNSRYLTVSDVDGSVWEINATAQTATSLGTLPDGAWPIAALVRQQGGTVLFITESRDVWTLDETTPADSTKVGALPAGLAQPVGMSQLLLLAELGGDLSSGPIAIVGNLDVVAPAPISLEGDLASGAINITGNLDSQGPSADLEGDVVSGAIAIGGNLDVVAPGAVSLEGDVASGAIALTGDLDVTAAGQVNLEGDVASGAIAITGDLDVVNPMSAELAGDVVSGAIGISGDLDVAAPGSVNLEGDVASGAINITGDLDVRGGTVSFEGDLRDGGISITGRLLVSTFAGITRPHYLLEVDLDNDGRFANVNSDVFDDLQGDIMAHRGRNFGGQIYGRNVAGTLSFKLRNDDGKYDRFDPMSPTYQQFVPGRLVRIRMAAQFGGPYEPIWWGRLDDVLGSERRGDNAVVDVRALGKLADLAQPLSVPYRESIETRDATEALLLAAGLTASDIGTLDGDYLMRNWYVRQTDGFDALRAVEETERGFVFEARDGTVRMLPGSARRAAATPSGVVIETNGLTDWPALKYDVDDPLQDIANVVTVPVRQYAIGALTGVWTLTSAPLILGPGEMVDFAAPYPIEGSPTNHVGVARWIDPVEGVDYDADPNLSITTRTTVGAMYLTVRNLSPTNSLRVPFLLVRAHPLERTTDLLVERTNTASITAYGRREYPAPAQFLNDRPDAASYAGSLLRDRADPDPRAHVTLEAEDDLACTMGMELGMIVTLRRPTGDQQMVVESIRHRIRAALRHHVTLTLTPALPAGGEFRLDDAVRGRLDAGNYLRA